jgi:hypothetical protein
MDQIVLGPVAKQVSLSNGLVRDVAETRICDPEIKR